MEHFIAYHSVKTMGYAYKPDGELNFLSRKLALLKRAIGNTIWVVQGAPSKAGTDFTLIGSYRADTIEVEDKDSGLYVIKGGGVDLTPAVPLNALPWFGQLKKAQSNFSLGFNTLNDAEVISALTDLMRRKNQESVKDLGWEFDADFASSEGARILVAHLRRERDGNLVKLKKQRVVSEGGRLTCEICGFDFEEKYGVLGAGFCEVHHRLPLGEREVESETKLGDLAIVCANCHRMVHRTSPILSIEDLRARLIKIDP
jgi:hypothetical protein